MLWVTPLARDQVKVLWGKVDMYVQLPNNEHAVRCDKYSLNFILDQLGDGAKVFLTPNVEDYSDRIVEHLKHTLFDEDDKPINGFECNFKTWCGDSHSFIITDDDGDEYRVIVQKEPKE